MKRPDNAEPGWYDDPEMDKYERYWNGQYWESQTRRVSDDSVGQPARNQFKLGRFLFRYPLSQDKSFVTYCVVLSLSLFFGISSELRSGTRTELIPIMTIPLIPLVAVYIYIFFLPYLFVRRRRDKKKGIGEFELKPVPKNKFLKMILGGGAGILVALFALGTIESGQDSDLDVFIQNQERISEILGRYNSEAGAAVGVVRGISDGTLSAGEGIGQFSTASSKITPILSELRTVCEEINFPEVTGEGLDLAISQGMNILKVACEVTPKQFLVLTEIFREQINQNGTQSKLDQLSQELDLLNKEKRDAAIRGINAMLPYADESQAEIFRALLRGFENQ